MYGVLVFEAMATFIGQVSVLSLIAIFGAATTAMVNYSHKLFLPSLSLLGPLWVCSKARVSFIALAFSRDSYVERKKEKSTIGLNFIT